MTIYLIPGLPLFPAPKPSPSARALSPEERSLLFCTADDLPGDAGPQAPSWHPGRLGWGG